MTFFERIRRLWRGILSFPKTIAVLCGPPPDDGYAEPATEPGTSATIRDPKVTPAGGDVFAGVHGGIRRFRGFDLDTGDAVFTRANRPNLYREPRAKWFNWVRSATIISRNETL